MAKRSVKAKADQANARRNAAAHITAADLALAPGERCRVCGCTYDRPCFIANEQIEGDGRLLTCSWVDAAHTLCSNPKCVAEIPLAELEAICQR